jgi:Zn-dependent protease with chaperone function
MLRIFYLSTLTLLLVLPPSDGQEVSNPELFKKTLGAANEAIKHYGSYECPEELQRVSNIGYRIAQESRYSKFPFTFYLVEMPEPNAFALPGGQIFVTRGMLDLGLSDDMLAGLLGHEIGHVILEHGIKLKRRATLLNALSQAALVGVIIGASGSDDAPPPGVYDPFRRSSSSGDLIQGTAAAGAIVSELLMRDYSRDFEDESDEEGQRLAAAAGFDPDGSRQLMDTLRAHLPQSREYGYWRTHPFFSDRQRSAESRGKLLKIQDSTPADSYRAETQASLLRFADRPRLDEELSGLLRDAALTAWPQGEKADELRLGFLHDIRDTEKDKSQLSQDFGLLAKTYQSQISVVSDLTPESPLLATLQSELDAFEAERKELHPVASKVFADGIFETEFLETFLSNYPSAPEAQEVAYTLAVAYSRLGRESDSVALFLRSWEGETDDQIALKASQGLRGIAPSLNDLGALQQLADQGRDDELKQLAAARLSSLASTYDELDIGAAYLRNYPSAEHVEAVGQRLNDLAQELLGEVVLYQTVGDQVKAIERIQQILTHAPSSPAAATLRDRMVLES